MIEERVVRFVAAADVTDDCRVEVVLRRRRQALTTSQARELAAELVRAAGEAESAAGELMRLPEPAGFDRVFVSPECQDRFKHGACIGRAWDDGAEAEVECDCPCHLGAGAA